MLRRPVCRAVLASALLACGVRAPAQQRREEPPPLSDTERVELPRQGAELVAAVAARVGALLAAGPAHPLFTRHLRTTEALSRTQWIRAELLMEDDPQTARDTVRFLQKILDGLNGDAGNWAGYAEGRRSLLLGISSPIDGTLQPYSLRLPRQWDPEKAYPVIVYLHGHVSDPSQLWFAQWGFSPGEAKPAAGEEGAEPHVTVAPWGLGNAGYTGPGEMDVWAAIRDAGTICRMDPDRMILTGHSMGAFGTWAIGTRAPDRWAALALYSGGTAAGELAMAENVSRVPVLLWHGAKDETVPIERSYAMRDALRAVGNEPRVIVDPEAGHMTPGGLRGAHKAWLLEQRRKRPDRFSYVAYTRNHAGAWGIVLPRLIDLPASRFTCRIEGSTVHIDSENAAGLDVDLGAKGLGLEGPVIVLWNGQKAYEGPADKIKLGEGSGRNRWRF